MADEIRIEDGPKWDAQVSVRGVTLRLVSPIEIGDDLPATPLPDQAALDRQSGRRVGAFVRLWRWLAGEPRLDRAALPDDGGAAHARRLCLAMYGAHHAEFLATLTTGEIFQLTQFYMGYQARWGQALHDWGAEQAEKRYGSVAKPADAQPAQAMHDVVAAAFGPARKGFATGIVAGPDLPGGHTLNGQVKFPGGAEGGRS
jgi:hypothetical protein